MDKQMDLSGLLDLTWDQLVRGALQPRHEFHWPVIATTNNRAASVRTVVLRKVDRAGRLLWMYSDQRAAKMEELAENPHLEWCFFSKKHMFQVRATGKVLIQTEGRQIDTIWQNLPEPGKMNYRATSPPGTPLKNPEAYLPEVMDTEYGKENFALISTQVDTLDCLHLHREGAYRARFEWQESWKGSWVIP